MDRYVDSIKKSLSSNEMRYEECFIHPEEYGNEKINEVIQKSNDDIHVLDTKIKDLGNQTNELLERTVKRLEVVMDTINSEKERLQDIIMLCNLKTDYENAISLKDSDFDGKFEYENGVFSCKTTNTSNIASSIEEVSGNGYEGNKYVRNSNGYQEKVIATNNRHAAVDSNLSTYWEYSRITASSTEEYLISDFHVDDAEANCTVTFKLKSKANELLLKSNLNTIKIVNVRYSNDGLKYTDLPIMPFTMNQKDESYKNQGYIYGSNIISFPESSYIKITFQSTGYSNETIAFERSVAEEGKDKVNTFTTIVPSAKRHVVRINDTFFREKIFIGDCFLNSRELIDKDTNVYAISIFANTYLPEGLTNDNIQFILTVNGNDYKVKPVNSHEDGTKIIRFSQGKMPNKYTAYIGEKIQSASLTIKMRPLKGLSPYINNLKILLGGEI